MRGHRKEESETTMTIKNPSAADITTLTPGETYKVNGRKYVFDMIADTGSALLVGIRGGWANIVPSIGGTAVQITTLNSRDWVRTIESV